MKIACGLAHRVVWMTAVVVGIATVDQVLLKKDGIALALRCTGFPQHPFAELRAAGVVA